MKKDTNLILNCKSCKYCQHELWLYGFVCKLSNKFLNSEKSNTIYTPNWCELSNIKNK
jgi:hypothetical protein